MNQVSHIKETLRLSLPLILGQLAMLSMSFVDTVMVGHLGSLELAAVGIGGAVWITLALFVIGVMMMLPAIVSHLIGEGKREKVGYVVHQAFYIALTLGLLLSWGLRSCEPILHALNVDPLISEVAMRYLRATAWGAPAFTVFLMLRMTCEGLSMTRTSMMFGIFGLLINIPSNYVLIFGHFGFPQLGAEGAGYATSIVQWLQLIALYLWGKRAFSGTGINRPLAWPDRRKLVELLHLGLPIGMAVFIEGSLFGMVALLLGSFGTNIVAAHQIAINFAGLLFMIPLGISTVITIRVGEAYGRKDQQSIRNAAKAGFIIVLCIQIISAALILLGSQWIVRLYTNDVEVMNIAIQFLFLAAIFQIPDGIQVAAAGALRGLKDTRIPMFYTMIAYWVMGIPAGYLLGVSYGYGAEGVWWGPIIGLTVAAILLYGRFWRQIDPERD